MKWYFIVFYIYVSLKIKDVKHLIVDILVICMTSVETLLCLYNCVLLLLFLLFLSLLLSFLLFLYVLSINTLWVKYQLILDPILFVFLHDYFFCGEFLFKVILLVFFFFFLKTHVLYYVAKKLSKTNVKKGDFSCFLFF